MTKPSDDNLLMLIYTPGERAERTMLKALVPWKLVSGYVWDRIHGLVLNQEPDARLRDQQAGNQIRHLYRRFGLEPSHMTKDLEKYLDPDPSAMVCVRRVVFFGWAV